MKKILIFTQFLFLITNFVFSQSGWQKVNPYPTFSSLIDVTFINNTTGFACGWWGTLLKTTNGAQSWEEYNVETNSWFHSIVFVNDNTGLIASGTLFYRTTNGGVNWDSNFAPYRAIRLKKIGNNSFGTIGYIGNSFKLFKSYDGLNWQQFTIMNDTCCGGWGDLHFINDNTGFVLKNNYTNKIAKTLDGGLNWTVHTIPILIYGPNRIYFVNDNTGFITANNNTIYRTTDSGQNWSNVLPQNYNEYSNSISFLNSQTGFVTGSKIVRTTNSGLNWNSIDSINTWSMNAIGFKSSQSLFAVGAYGRILESNDMGNSWQVKSKNVFNDAYPPVRGCRIFDQSNFLIGVDGNPPKVYRTSNAGVNWTQIPDITAIKFEFPDNLSGFTVSGTGNAVYKTANMGNNWADITPQNFNDNYYDLSFINSSTGVVSGVVYSNGSMLLNITSNSGNSWQRIVKGNLQNAYIVKMLDLNNIIIASSNDIYRTSDRGNSWVNTTTLNLWNNVYFNFIEFTDLSTGYVGCQLGDFYSHTGRIYKTTNSGFNWTLFYDDSSYVPNQMYIHNINTFTLNFDYRFGDNNRTYIKKTTDGGNSWILQYQSNDAAINSINFANEEIGLAVGNSGFILKTTNSGNPISISNISVQIPQSFSLHQNYPNPFNPVTKIQFEIPANAGNGRDRSAKLIIYDLLGREVTTLVNEQLKPGSYEVNWDGSGYASGVYFYSLIADEYVETKRMVLIK